MADVEEPSGAPAEVDPAIAERVLSVIAESQGVDASSLSLDSTFEELGFDSLDGLNVFFDIEEAFDLDIPDEVARGIKGVRQVVEYLSAHFADSKATAVANTPAAG